MLRCVGCGHETPAHLDTTHNAECDWHSHHTPTGWTRCRHDGVCYDVVQLATDEGIAA